MGNYLSASPLVCITLPDDIPHVYNGIMSTTDSGINKPLGCFSGGSLLVAGELRTIWGNPQVLNEPDRVHPG